MAFYIPPSRVYRFQPGFCRFKIVSLCHDLSSSSKRLFAPFSGRGARPAALRACLTLSGRPGKDVRAREHSLRRFGHQVFAMRGALRFLALGQPAAPSGLLYISLAAICRLSAFAGALASRSGAAILDSMHSRDPGCSAPVCSWAAGCALLHVREVCCTSCAAIAHRPVPWQPFRRGYSSDPVYLRYPRCSVPLCSWAAGQTSRYASVTLLDCTCSLCTLAVALAPVLQLSLLGIPLHIRILVALQTTWTRQLLADAYTRLKLAINSAAGLAGTSRMPSRAVLQSAGAHASSNTLMAAGLGLAALPEHLATSIITAERSLASCLAATALLLRRCCYSSGQPTAPCSSRATLLAVYLQLVASQNPAQNSQCTAMYAKLNSVQRCKSPRTRDSRSCQAQTSYAARACCCNASSNLKCSSFAC